MPLVCLHRVHFIFGHYGETLSIPNPLNREMAEHQFKELRECFLQPICETVTTETAVLERLLRDEIPFEWRRGNPITRVAEVIATATVAHPDLEALRSRLTSYHARLAGPMAAVDVWSSTLRRLFDASF